MFYFEYIQLPRGLKMISNSLPLLNYPFNRPWSFPTAVVGNTFVLGWSAQSLLSVPEKSVTLLKRYCESRLWNAIFTNAITHAIFLPFANAQRLEPTPNCYGSQYIIDLHTDTEMHVSRTVFTREQKSASWMIIRLPVLWTVCTQIYIAMHNLNCAIQFTVRCALLFLCENSLGDWQKGRLSYINVVPWEDSLVAMVLPFQPVLVDLPRQVNGISLLEAQLPGKARKIITDEWWMNTGQNISFFMVN